MKNCANSDWGGANKRKRGGKGEQGGASKITILFMKRRKERRKEMYEVRAINRFALG